MFGFLCLTGQASGFSTGVASKSSSTHGWWPFPPSFRSSPLSIWARISSSMLVSSKSLADSLISSGVVGCGGVVVADDGGLHEGGITAYRLIIPGLGVFGGVVLQASLGSNPRTNLLFRVSFYSRLPAGRDKSAQFISQISCEVVIHFIPNIACVIFTLIKAVIFQTV